MQTLTEHNILNSIEDDYVRSTSIEHRKTYAQFFTPYPIADLMSKWLLENKGLKTVLEPAFGLGIFTRILLERNNYLQIKGFEVDPFIFEESKKIFPNSSNVNLFLEDYMYNDWDSKYDGIVCNPPYFKFQDYDNKKILKEIEERIGCKLNGFTNLYTLFLFEDYPLKLETKHSINFEQLDPIIKWRAYYQKQNALKFKNLVPFTNYGKVVRGIATGANDYFTFNIAKSQQFGIEQKYLLPCICKAADVKNVFFTNSDLQELQQNNRPIFLLNAIKANNSFIDGYLEKGLAEGIDKTFLTASRKPWYSLENRPPAPIWVSVFNRNGLRFIRNEAGISNLTTFHCVYLNIFSAPKTDLLFAYLLTNVSRQIFEDNRREYGNGLQKFEPNDINKSKILDLELIDSTTEDIILNHYSRYRQSVLDHKPNENLINKINEIFLNIFSI